MCYVLHKLFAHPLDLPRTLFLPQFWSHDFSLIELPVLFCFTDVFHLLTQTTWLRFHIISFMKSFCSFLISLLIAGFPNKIYIVYILPHISFNAYVFKKMPTFCYLNFVSAIYFLWIAANHFSFLCFDNSFKPVRKV